MIEQLILIKEWQSYPTVGATAAVGVDVAPVEPNPKLGAAEVLAGGAPRLNPAVFPAGAEEAPNENVITLTPTVSWLYSVFLV